MPDIEFQKDVFLEHCSLPSTLVGRRVDLKNVEFSFGGITGFGSKHERSGKKSAWISGEIVSPHFSYNNGCAGYGHIEGIVTDEGRMRVLEAVYNFPAREGDCFDYDLRATTKLFEHPLEFEGEVIARVNRNNFLPTKAGKLYLSLNPFWTGENSSGISRGMSIPYLNQHPMSGVYTPQFWKTFLGEIEEQGYDHPYGAVTKKLEVERAEKAQGEMIDAAVDVMKERQERAMGAEKAQSEMINAALDAIRQERAMGAESDDDLPF
jgi:hypothetical protein